MDNQKIELTIASKGKVKKEIISDKCITAGCLIDLVQAATEAGVVSGEFIVCYAILTAEIEKGKEVTL